MYSRRNILTLTTSICTSFALDWTKLYAEEPQGLEVLQQLSRLSEAREDYKSAARMSVQEISGLQKEYKGDGDDAIGIIVETTTDVDDIQLREELDAVLLNLVVPSNMFESTIEDMESNDEESKFYYLEIVGARFDSIRRSPFDLTNYLQAELGQKVLSVEPDLETEFAGLESLSDAVDNSTPNDSIPLSSGRPNDNCKSDNKDYSWAVDQIKSPEAWRYSETNGKASRGAGIRIAQIDTGYTSNAEYAKSIEFETVPNSNFIGSVKDDPEDPNIRSGLTHHPGHGTRVGSVAVSRGVIPVNPGSTPYLVGSAPEATLVPFRTIRSVIRIKHGKSAKAINQVVKQIGSEHECHIITMSLGGMPSRALKKAIKAAVERGRIVVAAAGQVFPMVIWPARYKDCISLGGTKRDETHWGSAANGRRHGQIDLSAPAKDVWRVEAVKKGADAKFCVGSGTSYAASLTAGVAALWLAHFGKKEVADAASCSGETVQELFRRKLRQSARKGNWDDSDDNKKRYGLGIVNALDLLNKSLIDDPNLACVNVSPNNDKSSHWLDYGELLETEGKFAFSDSFWLEIEKSGLGKHGLEILWISMLTIMHEITNGREVSSDSKNLMPIPEFSQELRRKMDAVGIEFLEELREKRDKISKAQKN